MTFLELPVGVETQNPELTTLLKACANCDAYYVCHEKVVKKFGLPQLKFYTLYRKSDNSGYIRIEFYTQLESSLKRSYEVDSVLIANYLFGVLTGFVDASKQYNLLFSNSR